MKKATLILLGAAALLLALFTIQEYVSDADFSLENPAWNGLSGLPSSAVRPLPALTGLASAGDSDTLLIVNPRQNYTADEARSVSDFLDRGGRVVVMDDMGTANSLLAAIDAPIRIGRVALCDDSSYYVNRSFPIVTALGPSPETAGIGRLLFDCPVSLDVSSGASPLVSTSDNGWLDVNQDSILDGAERLGTYCVAAKAAHGRGELIVVGDSDLFINGMIGRENNRAFAENVLGDAVWVDVGHGGSVTPMGKAYYYIKYDAWAQAFAALLLLAGCTIYVKREDLSGWVRRYMSWPHKE